MNLYLMILAHLLYDFHWQGSFIADNKGKKIFLLFIHALTWTMLVSLPLLYFKEFATWKILVLFVSHILTDYWKSHKPRTDDNFYLIYIDQAIHFLSILIVSF